VRARQPWHMLWKIFRTSLCATDICASNRGWMKMAMWFGPGSVPWWLQTPIFGRWMVCVWGLHSGISCHGIFIYIYFHYILFIQSNFSHVSNCRYAKLHTIHFSISNKRMN
jgi:hypothetical protein